MSKRLNKFKRPIDYVNYDPLRALKEVFDSCDLDYILNELPFWFYMALSAEIAEYDDHEERRNFVDFYYELTYLVEAMYFFNKLKNPEKPMSIECLPDDLKEWQLSRNRCRNLSEEQTANPFPLIKRFCKRHSPLYVRIELGHFFEAVGNYRGRFTQYINGQNAFNFYLNLLCLAEVGYRLTTKPKHRRYK